MSTAAKHRPHAEMMESEMTNKELSLLEQILKETPLKGVHLEVGTGGGGTLCRMMNCYPADQRPRFMVVDPLQYFPNQEQVVERNLERHGISIENVKFNKCSSNHAFQLCCENGDQFSFILIDGAHKIRYVTEDLRWGSLLEEGGLLCIHDYCPAFPDVQIPVDRFLARNKNYCIVKRSGSLLILKRKSCAKRETHLMDFILSAVLSPLLQFRRSMRKRASKQGLT